MANKNETAIVEIVLKGQQANSSLKEMEKSARALSAQLKNLPKDSQEFADKKAEFQKMSKSLKDLQNDVKGVGGVFQSISKEIKGFGILAIGYLGFDWLKSSVSGIIKRNAELSDSLADIRKTTGMTEAEARKLNTSFSQINTRTATKELRNIAIVGGQLGIAKNDILGFTIAVDKMNVALGDEFSGGAEEVTKAMGGLRNIFTDIKSNKVDEDLLHIGNAINELASSGAATGPVVSDFANRIGGVGITLGLTSGQVLGLSATLQELNVSTERGGTAVTKILQKMTTNTAEFAKVAKMPVQEFTNLVNKDLYGAFVKVVEGSKQGGASATVFGQILNDLGVDGAGAAEVFAKLGNNTKLLGEKVILANSSLKNTDSILAEFSTKNTTLGAEMDRLSKGFASAFTNSAVSEGLKSIVSLFADLFDKTKKVSDITKEERKELMMTETEIFSYNAGNETRTKLIKELQDKYPDYLKNIDAETVGNNELHNALDKVNASLINKILIQKKDEEIQELADIAGEKKLAATEAKRKMIESLTAAYNSNAYALKFSKEMEGLPVEVQAEQIIQPANFNKAGLSAYNSSIIEIKENLAKWKKLEAEVSGASIPLNEVLNEKSQLMKILGIETEKSNTQIVTSTENKDKILTTIDDETKKKLSDAHKKYIDDLIKLQNEFDNRHQSQNDKEKQAIYDKYKVFLAAEKEGSDAYKSLIFKRDIEIDEFETKLREKYLNDRKEAQNKINRTTQTDEQNEIDDVNKKFKELTDIAISYEIDTVALEEARQLALLAVREKYNKAELDANEAKNKKIEESENQKFEKASKIFNGYYQGISSALSGYNDTQKNMADDQTKQIKKQSDTDLAANKRLLDAKIIGQSEYNRRNRLLEEKSKKEISEIKKRAAENDKKIAIFNALMNAGIAISRAFKDYMFPASLGIAALAGASAMLQVSAISSAPVPEFAAGGFNRTSNNPQGFTTGATLYTNSASGSNFIAGEKGKEWIAPNWMLQNPVTANTIEMLEAVRTRGFESGGSTSTVTPKFENSIKTQNQNYSSNGLAELAIVVDDLKNTLEQIKSDGIPAYINYDLYVKTMNSFDSAKASAQIKN